jgi:hypothetical protein
MQTYTVAKLIALQGITAEPEIVFPCILSIAHHMRMIFTQNLYMLMGPTINFVQEILFCFCEGGGEKMHKVRFELHVKREFQLTSRS